jgi:parallel beta-helix repeat protein
MTVILLVPVAIGVATVLTLWSGLYAQHLAELGSSRLLTNNWSAAATTMEKAQPDYERKFAYYEVKKGQTPAEVAKTFGVKMRSLRATNRGPIAPGSIIKVTPVSSPLKRAPSTGTIGSATIEKDGDLLRVINEFDANTPIVTTIPELAQRLKRYDAIDTLGHKTYRLNRAISIEGDIRVDITRRTVSSLQLTSTPDVLASLVFDESTVLIKRVNVSSIDPSTDDPDVDSSDGRSFLRMKNGRMDIIGSTISHLGNGLTENLSASAKISTAQGEGGTYGLSYRIDKGKLGSQITTGWVENSTFTHNHFGAYTFGASGMVWKNNRFADNEVYGLDPHDDSNNALIEGNLFEHNGKHGFIVSKRCNFNIIRGNRSVDNKLHGFMLHQDSAFNLIQDNVASGNVDNFVVYGSNFNTIRDNRSFAPRSSHIRVNSAAHNTFVTGNLLDGGSRGVYLYDRVAATYVAENVLRGVKEQIQTVDADETFYGGNVEASINYDITPGDTVIYGVNRVYRDADQIQQLVSHHADVP